MSDVLTKTRKLVVNKCHGGFGLSEAAVRAYAARKGLTLYPEPSDFSAILGPTWWTVPPEDRPKALEGAAWYAAPMEERQAFNAAYAASVLTDRDIARDDVDLVAVVETLGEDADARFGKLQVVEIPSDVDWTIEEYDGLEWVAEKHRTW